MLNTLLFVSNILKVNPGPDFKQTGNRLEKVIVNLWDQTCKIVFPEHQTPESWKNLNHHASADTSASSFTKVYDKEWSTSNLSGGGMKMTK
jgi:hypothetical protein